jgi:pSer/pThr/pTyr-binding forkhead associated (FHA) protein
MTDDELITAVVPFLAMPPHFVQASQDHANSLHEKHSKAGVQAYAKLAGKDWTFYVKQLRNNIGRPPEGSNPPPGQRASPQLNGGALPDASAEENRIHIDLGPSKMVSRLHAEIYFDPESERWNIHVNGRNGIRINNDALRRGQKHKLVSGEIIEIGGVEMMFVLPEENGSLKIKHEYLLRAGLVQTDDDETNDGEPAASTSPARPSSSGLASSRGQNGLPGPLPIAPAPPDYKRPGTPVSARTKAPYSTGKSPAYANGGTILMNADDIDLSLDCNQHIKPSYSYAQMISQAILDTEDEKLNLNGIYNYIMDKYAYYRHQLGGGWQVSRACIQDVRYITCSLLVEFYSSQSVSE